MKTGVLAGGAVLLIIGFVVFGIGYWGMQQYNTSVGQIAQVLSPQAQAQAQQFSLMALGGGIFALVGLVVCIYGAVASPSVAVPIKRYQYNETARVASPEPNSVAPSNLDENTLVICPNCNYRMPQNVKFCPECGSDVRQAKSELLTTTGAQEKVLLICPNCNKRVPADTKFCPECGANLSPKAPQ